MFQIFVAKINQGWRVDLKKVHLKFNPYMAQARLVDEKLEGLEDHSEILSDPDVEHMKEMAKNSAEEALLKLSKTA